jgi:hypothetical protein
MARTQVETVLNQMKRSFSSQVTLVITANGQTLVPYSESRVSLVISAHAAAHFSLSFSQTPGVDMGIFVPTAGAPLNMSLATHGSVVKGPIFVVDGVYPSTLTYWETLLDAP